jgi:hypothetical protein
MPEGVLTALIGVLGTAIGAIATVLVARIQAQKEKEKDKVAAQKVEEPQPPAVVLGEVVDHRELRILRALFGERRGRLLDAYKGPFYGSSLEAVQNKGWVRKSDGKFYLTEKGADLCRAYVKELLQSWKPII